MNTWVGSLLVIAVVVGSLVALVSIGFLREAGRQRLLPLLRPLLKGVINPRTLQAVERGESKYAVVHHAGRRSGKPYHTPVEAYRTAEGVLILLPYGPVTDWCRNVLAAGQCTVSVDGHDLAVSAPLVIPAGDVEAQVPANVARRWQREGIAHFLWLKSAPPIAVEVKPALASTTAAVAVGAEPPA
jgi:deazaflavin-dependent oxidoreductase (nitroreductase family)